MWLSVNTGELKPPGCGRSVGIGVAQTRNRVEEGLVELCDPVLNA